jgi:hypothetical protein
MPMGEAEQRIRRLMARIAVAEYDTLKERDRAGKVEQDLQIIRSGFGTCTSTITGTVYGGRLVGFAGATVRMVGETTGADYGTATADGSGIYTFAGQIGAADSGLDAYTGHTNAGGRLDGATKIRSVSFDRCTTRSNEHLLSASPGRGVIAASGYVYPTATTTVGPCDFPISTTLDTIDTGNAGTFTSTWSPSTWSGAHGGITYDLSYDAGLVRFNLRLTPPGTIVATALSWTCPDPATSTKFSVVFSLGGGRTVTCQEP